MKLSDEFDRLTSLIEEREDHFTMKSLLGRIRDQVDQSEAEKSQIATHATALEFKLSKSDTSHREEITRITSGHLQAVADLKAQNEKLVAENARLVSARQQQPITPEQQNVLLFLNAVGDYCKQEIVAQKLGIDSGR